MKRIILVLLTSLITLTATLSMPLSAVASDASNAAQQGACGVTGDVNCTSTTSINDIATIALRVLQVVVGFVAVFMIIIGGLRYITSGGDAQKLGSAKNTILYACIGIVIVALSQVIIQFVLNRVNNVSKPKDTAIVRIMHSSS